MSELGSIDVLFDCAATMELQTVEDQDAREVMVGPRAALMAYITYPVNM